MGDEKAILGPAFTLADYFEWMQDHPQAMSVGFGTEPIERCQTCWRVWIPTRETHSCNTGTVTVANL